MPNSFILEIEAENLTGCDQTTYSWACSMCNNFAVRHNLLRNFVVNEAIVHLRSKHFVSTEIVMRDVWVND